MRKLVSAVAILLASISSAWAASPPPLTTLSAIHALTNDEAHRAIPVVFEATVTYYRSLEHTLFVQDGDAGIYVSAPSDAKLVPGDRVLVRGKTQDSFNPFVKSDSITWLRHGLLPKPIPASFEQMIRAETDCKLVTLRAVIRSADFMDPATQLRFTNLQLLTESGYFNATVDGGDATTLEGLLDAEVELTGVASESFDGKMQVTGILVHIQSPADIRVLRQAVASPWSLPVTSMDRVLAVYHVSDSTQRVRVHGTITYYEPGSAVILQDGAKSIWISTETRSSLQIGDVADATGFPDAHDGFLNLVHGEIRDSHTQAPVPPVAATWQSLTPHGNTNPGHHDDLVSIEGEVVTQVREASQDEYVVATDSKLFSAIYRHLDGPPSSAKLIPLGSRVRVTGICILEVSNPFIAQVPFNILLRSFDDIVVVAEPSWLNIQHLIRLVSVLLLVVVVLSAWGAIQNRKVRRQTVAMAARSEAEATRERRMAQLEQRRSRVLEDINGARPLAEILEEITEMVSFRLEGARCWCEVTDGARLGNYPNAPETLRTVCEPIPARVGAQLGFLFAAFPAGSVAEAHEEEALSVGARLATLAIETRRLYSDLLHRSEFDLLTDIHNRFSLEKCLDALIEQARQKAGIFGLIFIDLDEFKQVNDLYGHRVGDLYLQEVALRMKHQLRGHDMLARLGGDEFAVLVSVVRNRAAAQEIAHRLERCFDDPFTVEGYTLHGAASVGLAIYPEDGATRDSLLSASDAAMYVTKHTKQHAGGRGSEH